MDKFLELDVQGEILVASVSGDRPNFDVEARDLLTAWWQHTADECARLELHRLLVLSVVEARSSSVTLAVFSDFARFGFSRAMKIAVVHPTEAGSRVAELGIKVARSDGWDIQMFSETAAARDWLGSV